MSNEILQPSDDKSIKFEKSDMKFGGSALIGLFILILSFNAYSQNQVTVFGTWCRLISGEISPSFNYKSVITESGEIFIDNSGKVISDWRTTTLYRDNGEISAKMNFQCNFHETKCTLTDVRYDMNGKEYGKQKIYYSLRDNDKLLVKFESNIVDNEVFEMKRCH